MRETRKTEEVVITVWGDFACWTRPECKVERLSYPVPTPSAIRGLLSAIYIKPTEFYWQVKKIEVLSPIDFYSVKKNEVKNILHWNQKNPLQSCIDPDECRTQRLSVILKDVRYRITAEMVLRPEFNGTPEQLYCQFRRRAETGQNYYQPYMGIREYVAYYEWGTDWTPPIRESMDLGLMVYDIFDVTKGYGASEETSPNLSIYWPEMKNGVIEVPPYDSPWVRKSEGGKI